MSRIYMEVYKMQILYDKETDYHKNEPAQSRWEALVKKQLFALRAYKSTAADCASLEATYIPTK